MKILILNWRDFKDPKSGGAEVLTWEIAKGFVQLGHQVTQRNSWYKGAKKHEVIDGVEFKRRGSYLTTYIYSFLAVLFHQEKFDVILDEVHGIPFFTPLITRKPVVAFPMEVAKDHWSLIYPFPINIVGRLLEKFYFWVYRNNQFLTISPSSKNSLIEEGIPAKNITVIPMGVNATLPKVLPKKEAVPTVIFLGRLAPIKGIEDAIIAVSNLKKDIPKIKLWIVGSGDHDYVNHLHDLVQTENLTDSVKFFGFVNEAEKFELIAKAQVLAAPSKNEGWGLIVPEAGLVGTPAVVYNVNGLRDIVKNNDNGIITKENNASGLAEGIKELLTNDNLYKKVRENITREAKLFNWDKSTKVSLEVIGKQALQD